MTDREKVEVKKMWEQGMSAVQIARLLPYKEYISVKEIAELKKCGFLPPRSVKIIRDKTIIAEFENNKNLLNIADKYGISVHYVRLILNRNKVRHPKVMNFTQKKPNDKIKAIIKELASKKSQSQIAREHNVSRQYINEIKNKWEVSDD